MRNKGSKTCAKCWRLDVVNQGNNLFSGEFSTLTEIGQELGLSYHQVVEMSSGRKKPRIGKYDTSYRFTRLSPTAEKLNEDNTKPQETLLLEEVVDSS
jgi:hypothetical protein